jgi:SET domain-containing protein
MTQETYSLDDLRTRAGPPLKLTHPSDGLHPSVQVQESSLGGYGLFAIADIPQGTILWSDESSTDVPVRIADVLALEDPIKQRNIVHYGYQVSTEHVCGAWSPEAAKDDVANFMNHSCDPNCWFEDDTTMSARRNIKRGEEITYDYATSETYEWPSNLKKPLDPCLCGTALCRGKMTPHDWKLVELRKRYGRHWMKYILELFDQGL